MKQIARDMLPTLEVIVRSGIRFGAGVAVLLVAPSWLAPFGHVLMVMAAIGIVGHAETAFAQHAAAKLRLVWSVVLVPIALIGGLIMAARMNDDDLDGRPN